MQASHFQCFRNGRDGGIRTHDPLTPSQVRYQAALHPVRRVPDLKIRVVNVVDLMALQPQSEHPHGLPDEDFDCMLTTDKPVIFAFHGYPYAIHRLTYRRHNHDNLHARGMPTSRSG